MVQVDQKVEVLLQMDKESQRREEELLQEKAKGSDLQVNRNWMMKKILI